MRLKRFPCSACWLWTAVKLLKISIYLLIATLIAEAILSWVNPHTPLAPMLFAVNRPFLQPLRRSIPPVGNVDLSVLVLLIICQLILIVPIGGLEQAVHETAVSEWYRRNGEVLTLTLHVQPGAKRTDVAGLHGEALKIRLAAPPIEGRANEALLKFIAESFERSPASGRTQTGRPIAPQGRGDHGQQSRTGEFVERLIDI